MNIFSWLNGLSAVVVLAFGNVVGITLLIKYWRERKKLLPFAALMQLSVAYFFLGPAVTFFSLLLTSSNISPVAYGFLSYSHMPLSILNAMYLGYEIFNPKQRNKALLVFGLTGIVYYIALIGWPQHMFVGTPGADPMEMLDISLRSVILVCAMFYIVCVIFVLGGGFYFLRKKIEGIDRKRASNLSLSFLLFAFAAILDTVITSQLIMLARVIMALSVIYLYRGFNIKEETQTPHVKQEPDDESMYSKYT
ncbi:MAG: hypothetical protein Q6370_012260 [Candidatus Sigynarchaeota archaeon]